MTQQTQPDQAWMQGLLDGYTQTTTAETPLGPDTNQLPRRNVLRIIGGSVADNPNYTDANGNQVGSTDVTVGGGGGGAAQFTPTVDGASQAVAQGDATVTAGNTGNANVKRAIASTIAASPGPQGMVVAAAPPGGTATVAVAGIVPNAISGMGTGAAARVGVTAGGPNDGKPQRLGLPRGSEAIVGNVDAKGNVTVAPQQHIGTTPRHVINVCAAPYNAVPDFQIAQQSNVTPGAVAHLTGFPNGTFTAEDVGKSAVVLAGGAVDASTDLHTTISAAGGTGGTNANGSDVILAASLVYAGIFSPLLVISWGTDNTAAIQAAHDAAYTAGGHTIHIPYGSYLTMSTLNFKSFVNIQGDSRGSLGMTDGGSRIMYGGTGTAISVVAPSTAFEWSNFTVGMCTKDSLIGIAITDLYYATFRCIQVIGAPYIDGVGAYGNGCATSGWWIGAASINTAFLRFIDCSSVFCKGDGVRFDSTHGSTYSVCWDSGHVGANGGAGFNSVNPGGGDVPSVQINGVDFEGANSPGCVTGYYDMLDVSNCYLETSGSPGAGGALVDITGSQYAYMVTVRNNHIAKWGTRVSPIYLASGAGINGVVVEGNYSPDNASFWTSERCLVTLGGCHRARIGANYSYLPVVDVVGGFDGTHDLGLEVVTYPFVLTGIASSGSSGANIAWDAGGHVQFISPTRIGAILSIRGFLTAKQSAGHWKMICGRYRTGGVVSISNTTPPVVTTNFPHSWPNSMTVIFNNTGNVAYDGIAFAISPLTPTTFELPAASAAGAVTGGDIEMIVRDTGNVAAGALALNPAETFQDSGGNAYLILEDYMTPGKDVITAGFSTDSAWVNSEANLCFVGEIVVGYKRLSTDSSGL